MNDLVFRSAVELARLIRKREASAEEVLEAHLRQIAEHDGALNAVVTLDEEGARSRARQADQALARGDVWGPLHGVPVTIKDCFETAGLRTTSGFPPLKNHVPTEDATAVARLRAAGAVIMGKTNLSLLATDYQTDNPVFGRTNNPWDTTRTAGGSSGGSGAAVAAGLSPLDLGSDLAGSIRVPSHCCGVYGLKPTEHRVSSTGHIPDWHIPGMTPKGSVRHMGVYGPLARSVADLRFCLSVIAGPDARRPEVPPLPIPDDPAKPPPVEELRIAWTDRFGDAVVSAETRDTLEKAATTLERQGASVERIEPGLDYGAVWRTLGEVVAAELGGPMPFLLRNMFYLQFRLMPRSPAVKGFLRGLRLDMRGLARALAYRDEVVRSIEDVFGRFDAWLCPVTTTPAFTHRKSGKAIEVDGRRTSYWVAIGAYTMPFNVSGNPVVVLPAGRSKEGLPIGVQVVGPRWRDERLLDIAATLDDCLGDFRHPPGYRAADSSRELEPSV